MNSIPHNEVQPVTKSTSIVDACSNTTMDITYIKNSIQGYTAAQFENISEYQAHLTQIQLIVKANKKKKLLNEIITDFFRLDYKQNVNWNAISDRVGKDKWHIYNDFIERINPRIPEVEPKLLLLDCEDYYAMSNIKQSIFRSIIKDLRHLTPDLTIAQLNNLLQGRQQQNPILWAESQYAFDYFIKNFSCIPNYKRVINLHFTFKDGPAKVRQGGTNHTGKPYVDPLNIIIKKIQDL